MYYYYVYKKLNPTYDSWLQIKEDSNEIMDPIDYVYLLPVEITNTHSFILILKIILL